MARELAKRSGGGQRNGRVVEPATEMLLPLQAPLLLYNLVMFSTLVLVG